MVTIKWIPLTFFFWYYCGPSTSCKMGTRSFLWVKCSRGVLLTTHPLLAPQSRKS